MAGGAVWHRNCDFWYEPATRDVGISQHPVSSDHVMSKKKRTTQANVATAAETETTDPSAPAYFVHTTLMSMSTKMNTFLAGQAALERGCERLEIRVDTNSTQINPN